MVIIETSIFSRQVKALLPDEEYRKLLIEIILHPNKGYLIPGSRGLRKIRWRVDGRGMIGGLRTIYFWAGREDQKIMLFMYLKKGQADLSADQFKNIRKLVKEEFK